MNKILKTIIITGLSLCAMYFAYSMFTFAYYGHSIELKDYKRYLWMFKDSVRNDVDTFIFSGQVKERDIYYHYNFRKDYFFSIWEFKDLGSIDLNSIKIDTNEYLGDIDYESSETFNPDCWPSVKLELGFEFNDYLAVKINELSSVSKFIKTPKYVGVMGNIHKLSIEKEKNMSTILFEYPICGKQSIFLFYKAKGSLFLILINSRDIPFDEKVIDFLNLE